MSNSTLVRMAATNMTQVLEKIGAGEGNRTLVISLEGCCSTIELHPQGPSTPLHTRSLASVVTDNLRRTKFELVSNDNLHWLNFIHFYKMQPKVV